VLIFFNWQLPWLNSNCKLWVPAMRGQQLISVQFFALSCADHKLPAHVWVKHKLESWIELTGRVFSSLSLGFSSPGVAPHFLATMSLWLYPLAPPARIPGGFLGILAILCCAMTVAKLGKATKMPAHLLPVLLHI
jgi:hypothetical protein